MTNRYHFYAKHNGRIYKVRADIPPDGLQYCAYGAVAPCVDILTGVTQDIRCLQLTPLEPLEVLAMMKDAT